MIGLYAYLQTFGAIIFTKCQYVLRNSYFLVYNAMYQIISIYIFSIFFEFSPVHYMFLEVYLMVSFIIYGNYILKLGHENIS